MVDELFVSLGLDKHEWVEDIKGGSSSLASFLTCIEESISEREGKRGMSRNATDCPGMSQDIICIYTYVYSIIHIIFRVVFVASPASSPSKGGGASPCIRLHPLY